MALKYRRILSICIVLFTNTVVGHVPPGVSKNHPEPEGNAAELFRIPPRPTMEVKLSTLRAVMAENGIQALIVPTTDAHNSLFISPADARQAWLTSYDNAAVTAVVTLDHALAWIGSIHVPQFDLESNTTIWRVMKEGIDISVEDWLAQNMPAGSVVAVDPLSCTRLAWTTLEVALKPVNVRLLAKPDNLVDAVRRILSDGPPARANNPILTLSQAFTGRPASNKIAEIISKIQNVGASALVLTALDDVAWTLNLRGSDIPYFPVFFSYLVIRADTLTNNVILFWGNGTLTEDQIAHQAAENQPIQAMPYDSIFNYLTYLSVELGVNGRIWVPATASHAVYQAIERGPASIITASVTPVALMKVVKNPVELEGFRRAHIRDGVAVIRALSWIDQQMAGQHVVSEMRISDILTEFRRDEEHFMRPSGASIVGAGENGAIFHYRPSRVGPQRTIRPDDMLLLDSGGHYLDGTTDITRTRHMGNCTEAQRRAFTRVMKGNINLVTSLMPRGTMGHTIDVLARKFLWDIGLDYAHNTGHGLGHFLKIHEFPPRINSVPQPNDPGVAPGMIYSIEPGYYELGQYGVRHEDIVETIAVTSTTNHPQAADLVDDFAGQGVIGFSTITQVPYQTSCLDLKLMTEFEIKYLNDFHAKIFRTIGPILQQRNLTAEYTWLERECRPINSATILEKMTPLLAAISVAVIWLGM